MKQSLFVFFALLLLPLSSQAFTPNTSSATRVTDDALMYTLTYELGFDKYELRTPVAAHFDKDSKGVGRETTYALLDQGETAIDLGATAGAVLSTAQIENGHYVVPKGETATFTLLVLVTLPEQVSENVDPVLTMTSLPFRLTGENDVVLDRGLNASELLRYRTDEVDVDIR